MSLAALWFLRVRGGLRGCTAALFFGAAGYRFHKGNTDLAGADAANKLTSARSVR